MAEGKVALITGAAQGIGYATAELFAERGASVVIADMQEDRGEEAAANLRAAGLRASFVRTDVRIPSDVEAMVQSVLTEHDRLDYAFNNAGTGEAVQLVDSTEETWDLTINTNLKGIWLCLRAEIPAIKASGGGAIVNSASTAGVVSAPDTSIYSASKSGVIGLTKGAALEWADQGIRINSLSPGVTNTALVAGLPEEYIQPITDAHPIGRIAEPREMAEAVYWLCSDSASFVTGFNLCVDGGFTAR